MNTTDIGNQNCEHVLGLLDSYLDNELSNDEVSQVADHLKQCEVCSHELDTRRAIRERLRGAMRSIPVSPNLHVAIQESIQSTRGSSRSFAYRKALPIAAALLICLSAAIAYRLGYLRLTKRSQESYLASISAPVADIMRVGLGDHVHCAVYRAFSKQHPTFEEMAHDLGQYKDLVPVVAKLIPHDYRIEMAHQCRYHTRRFVHLTMRKGSPLVSLVISRRGDGESFERDQLVPALTQSGIGIYQGSAQRFEISGFETPDYVVYVVSNLSREDNRDIMLALAPSVASFLRSMPG
jgi:hypothetical protein